MDNLVLFIYVTNSNIIYLGMDTYKNLFIPQIIIKADNNIIFHFDKTKLYVVTISLLIFDTFVKMFYTIY